MRVWKPLAKKSTANQRQEHNAEKKVYSVGYNVVADNTGLSSFVSCCCYPSLRNPAKFSKNSNLYSSKFMVIELGVNRKRVCNFLLVISSNFGRIS